MNKKTIAIGFTLFAMFFGAGNLIFPPSLGWVSGDLFWWAILGFIITGVGLPFLGMIAGSFSAQGLINEARRVHPVFAVLFMLAIYLTIGPFFAIPRTATVSYEMGVVPFLGEEVKVWAIQLTDGIKIQVPLLIFSSLYFVITYVLSIRPSKLVDYVGKVLTPLLLLSITALVVRAFFVFDGAVVEPPAELISQSPVFNGFLEGYNTMDTLAAIAFCIVILNAIRATGQNTQQLIFKDAFVAALIAGVALAAVYISLGWVGNHYNMSAEQYAQVQASGQNLGTYILSSAAHITYGVAGKLLLSVIVGLACLTTSIGLVVAVSSYFHSLWSRHSYRTYAIVFTLISFVLANQGLSQVIKGSIPVLLIVYPIAIALIALVFVDKALKGMSNLCFQLPMYTVTIVSVVSVVSSLLKADWIAFLPLSDISMQWLLPTVAALVVALIVSSFLKKEKTN
ncbi:MAG: branched-chain amino acid transport system II carrier protein [Saezia sp.]